LAVEEVHHLTLTRQTPGFPPLRHDYLGDTRTFATVVNEGWIFTLFSRFCPECLSEGDGTFEASPGAWKGIWRLPVTFACFRHDRYLDWQCPDCGSPAFSGGKGKAGRWRPGGLVPNPLAKLHPAQCRIRIPDPARPGRPLSCGARLDHDNQPVIRPSGEVIALQERLLQLVTGPTPGHVRSVGKRAAAAEYFNDLRTVMLLICATWPTSANLFPDAPELGAIASHLDSRRRTVSMRKHLNGRNDFTIRALDGPPPDAATSAALATLAARLLAVPESADCIDQLLAQRGARWQGRAKFLQLEPHCSPGLRTAVVLHADALLLRRHPGALPAFPQQISHQGRLEARHIPQRIPDPWFATLQDLDAPSRPLRRDVAIRLVQMAQGGTRRDAGLYLGFGNQAAGYVAGQLVQWMETGNNARAYDRALAHLADRLGSTPVLVDYQQRRAHLEQWVIPSEDWEMITKVVGQRQTRQSRNRTTWSPARHLGASALAWAQITHGEHQLAPALRGTKLPPPQMKAASDDAWRIQSAGRRPARDGFH
jgi:hypothetical protein